MHYRFAPTIYPQVRIAMFPGSSALVPRSQHILEYLLNQLCWYHASSQQAFVANLYNRYAHCSKETVPVLKPFLYDFMRL